MEERKMQKTKISKEILENKKTVDTLGLQSMLSCGRKSAVDIGMAAKAKITVGRRVLWSVTRIEKYLESISE